LKLSETLQAQIANAEAAIVKGQLHSDPEVAVKTKIQVGGFTIVNTGGFDDETMHKAAEVVEKAEKALTGHGLGKVCYGDILISKSINRKKNVMAFYVISSDEMFVRADIPADPDHVRYVCHELAHRLDHKFLPSKKKAKAELYYKIRFSAEKPPLPHIGDEVPYQGKTLKVHGYGEHNSIKMVDPSEQGVEAAPGSPLQLKHQYTAPLETVARWMGWKPKDTSLGFVTHYASTDIDENFAEMVSFYVLDKLSKPLTELLEPILFQ
jgi:hypothetical protein